MQRYVMLLSFIVVGIGGFAVFFYCIYRFARRKIGKRVTIAQIQELAARNYVTIHAIDPEQLSQYPTLLWYLNQNERLVFQSITAEKIRKKIKVQRLKTEDRLTLITELREAPDNIRDVVERTRKVIVSLATTLHPISYNISRGVWYLRQYYAYLITKRRNSNRNGKSKQTPKRPIRGDGPKVIIA